MAEKKKKGVLDIGGAADQAVGGGILVVAQWVGGALLMLAIFWTILAIVGCGVAEFVKQSTIAVCSANAAISMLQFGGILLTWAATFFDFMLQRGVLYAGTYLGPNGAFGIGISVVWKIIRDLVNLALIGGLIWASISMILNTGKETGKFVVQIIIAALLINFSYFFAGAILDASHFASRVIYDEAFNISSDTEKPTFGQSYSAGDQITARFMVATRLSSMYSLESKLRETSFTEKLGDRGILLLVGFVGLVLFIMTAWVFFTVASLFTQRFVVIVILLMTSPVAALAFTNIPKAKEYGDGWWKALYSQAIFPPILLILLAASFTVMDRASAQITQNASFLGLFDGPDPNAGPVGAVASGSWGAAWELMTVYIVGMGLMFASMKIATNIARQEPTKVPTTGEFYGAYKKSFGAVGKVGGMVAKVPGVKSLAGAIFTPTIAERYFKRPFDQTFSPSARRARDVSETTQAEYFKAIGEASQHAEGTAEHNDAIARAGVWWERLDEDTQKDVDKSDKLDTDEKKRAHTRAKAQGGAFYRGSGGSTVPVQTTQKPPAPTPAKAREIASGSAGMGIKEAIDHLAKTNARYALIDMSKEATTAAHVIEAFRGNGKGGSSQVPALPKQVLKQPKIQVLVNGHELIEIEKRPDINKDDWDEIAAGASDEARAEYERHASKRQKKRSPLPPKRPVATEGGSEEEEGGEPPLVADPSRRPQI